MRQPDCRDDPAAALQSVYDRPGCSICAGTGKRNQNGEDYTDRKAERSSGRIHPGKGTGDVCITVLGDYDSIYGFAALGLDIFPVNGPEEAKQTLTQLAEAKTGIIYVTEALAAVLKHEIDRYKDAIVPTIIQIPGISGNTGSGIEGVKKSVEQAVGSDILFGGN